MARRTGEGVRIGPITLLTLVSVLLLAVLADEYADQPDQSAFSL